MSLMVCLTGGSAGIGQQLCKTLVSDGHQVLMLVRSQERFRQAVAALPEERRSQVQPVICDLSSLSAIHTAAATITSSQPHLDVLVLNAGVINTRYKTTSDGYEETVAVNHLNQFLLLNLLTPLLLKANKRTPRVVIVSSELHKMATPPPAESMFLHSAAGETGSAFNGMQVYGLSKLYNVWTGRVLAERAQDKLWVASVSPGFVPTTGLNRDSSWIARTAARWLGPWLPFAVSVQEGAIRVSKVATDPAAPNEAPSGSYWAKRIPSPGSPLSQDMEWARQMWDQSIKVLDIPDMVDP